MENGSLIGALAIFTIGAALVIAIGYFGLFLRRGENREIAHRTLIRDDKSTATEQREKAGAGDPTAAPLKTRLDESEASSHPLNPDKVKNG